MKNLLLTLVLTLSLPVWGATATRTSAFEYDPVTGLLKKEIIEPDQAQFRLDTTYTYDTFGNKESATVSSPATGLAAVDPRTSSTTYDPNGQFPVTAVNALNHAETKTFDERFGTVKTLTGPNGLTTTWEYDGFGRKKLEIRADGSQTIWTYDECDAACPADAVYRIVTQVAAGGVQSAPSTVEYFDRLNRAIRNATQAFDGRWIYKDTIYDSQGRVQKVSRPYYAGQIVYWIESQYDELGRVLRVYEPDDVANPALSVDYNGLTVSRTNRKGQTTTEVKNLVGQKVSVTDAMNKVTTYAYDPFGNLTNVTAPGNILTSNVYDIRGRKTQTSDPDLGQWRYDYNALGELVKQTDAKNQVTSMSYDKLGRMTQRVEPGMTSDWIFDTSPNRGVGKLFQAKTSGGYIRIHTYDDKGRPSQTYSYIGADNIGLSSTVSYDAAGRLSATTYPSGFAVKQVYNAIGYLDEVRNNATNVLYWKRMAQDAEGHVTREIYGNGILTERGYQADNGRLQNITGYRGSEQIQGQAYIYDTIGNVTIFADAPAGQLEIRGGYDDLNRLTSYDTTINGVTTNDSLTYDALGNITSKTGVGNYYYGGNPNCLPTSGAGPHAVCKAGNNAYIYDANGNFIGGGGRSIVWTAWNMPSSIYSGGQNQSWLYDPEHNRYKLTAAGRTTWYLNPSVHQGGHYERTRYSSGTIEHRHTLYGGGQPIGEVLTFDGGAPSQTRYFHSDAQGSITAVTDNSGTVITRYRYDPWGKQTLIYGSNTGINQTRQGHTGHEMLDSGLTHMNGRIYDPVLARFVSADPYVDNPFDLQSLNRYSYVNNNPLGYTDPSGYFRLFGKKWRWWRDKVVKPVVVAVVAYYTGTWAAQAFFTSSVTATVTATGTITAGQATSLFTTANILGGAVGGATAGFTGTLAYGGSLGDAFQNAGYGAISGGITGGIRGYYGNSWSWERVAANSVAGGVSSTIQGGRFEDGFKSSAIGSGFRYLYNSVVKYDLDPRAGRDPAEKENPFAMPVQGANNIGTAEPKIDPAAMWVEGGVVSRIANQIPSINAIAGMHDVFQVRLQEWGGVGARNIFNVPGMPLAAAITWMGMRDSDYFPYDTIRRIERRVR